MSERTRRPGSKSKGPGRRESPPPARRGPGPDEPDLLGDIADALVAQHPLALLDLVSALLAALEPRPPSPFETGSVAATAPSREEVVQSFLDVDVPETTAVLAVIAAFSGDELLQHRIRREIAARVRVLPHWLAEVEDAVPADRAVEVVETLRDGDDILVGARLPGGAELTAVVYVDHNMGTLVKDAFVVPVGVDELVEQMLAVADPGTEARDLDPADARARITEAIQHGALTFPPVESESWPACRPLVEWITAKLPAGGTGLQRPDWDDAASAALVERFFASEAGAVFDDAGGRGLAEALLWFGTDYGYGDPQLWSPVAVEILLADWIPRKILADADHLAVVPDLLRAFIRFNHDERGVRSELTAAAIDAVDEYEQQYQLSIRSGVRQGVPGAFAAGPIHPWDLPDASSMALSRSVLAALRRTVGGEEALERLDTAPLPDEPFEWEGISGDVHERVAEVLVLVEGCCDALLGPEYRTACRRLLARVAAADPTIFRRKGRAATAAAVVCWLIGRANRLFDRDTRPHVLARDLIAHFGMRGSISQRSAAFLTAMGVDPHGYGPLELGSPAYLTGARRTEIIDRRNRCLAEI